MRPCRTQDDAGHTVVAGPLRVHVTADGVLRVGWGEPDWLGPAPLGHARGNRIAAGFGVGKPGDARDGLDRGRSPRARARAGRGAAPRGPRPRGSGFAHRRVRGTGGRVALRSDAPARRRGARRTARVRPPVHRVRVARVQRRGDVAVAVAADPARRSCFRSDWSRPTGARCCSRRCSRFTSR